jgi:2-dehydropantoate 2-reductase
MLAEVLGGACVLGGLCKIFSTALGPGHIRHAGFEPAILFGELGRANTERVARIRGAFETAKGMKVLTPDDVEAALWEKCLFVAPLGAVGAMTRQPAGVIRGVAATRGILRAAMEEFAAVARGRGVAVSNDAVERSLKMVDALPPEATASMQRDIAEGRPSELEYQVGTVVRFGRERGVAVPVTETIYGALLPYELQARGELESPTAAKAND